MNTITEEILEGLREFLEENNHKVTTSYFVGGGYKFPYLSGPKYRIDLTETNIVLLGVNAVQYSNDTLYTPKAIISLSDPQCFEKLLECIEKYV
jgi:hypothetical protein